MKSLKNLAVALAAGVLFAVGYSPASQAEPCANYTTYAGLMSGDGKCEIADKTFSGFLFGSTTGVTAAEIGVSIVNGPVFYGFDFTFNLVVQFPPGVNPSTEDFKLTYDVSCSDGTACIDSIHAAIAAGGFGGVASLAENYGVGAFFLCTPVSAFCPGGQTTFDGAINPPQSALHIIKDVNASCTDTNGCFVTFSGLENTVDQVDVPEPGTLALLAGSLLALGWVGRRRRDRG